MDNHYNKIVSFEIAQKLKEIDFRIGTDEFYAIDDITVTYDNYLGGGTIPKGETFWLTSGENYHGKYIEAPTYADVLDWLMDKGIHVSLSPWFTYALRDKVGYTFEISTVNEEEAKLDTEHWGEFASFDLCIECAINKAIEKLKK